jgi:hypothetical protein
MTPVRIELGVHFAGGESTSVAELDGPTTGAAFAMTVVCICLRRQVVGGR